MSTKVLVFGPTGGVGSSAALAAHKHGAKVYLGMRDTTKAIPTLTPAAEKEGGYERFQGDLTKPETLKDAAIETGAKHAFIYLTFGVDMRPSLEALKEGGIEFVVFLSSSSIQDDVRAVSQQGNIIAFMHAQAEIALEEVFGKGGYVAVRPGLFASNVKGFYAKGIKEESTTRIFRPELKFDNITSEDMGKVAGKLVAGGPKSAEGRAFISLCGPELLSQREMMGVIGSVLGKEIKVVEVGLEDGVKVLTENGLPEFVARTLANEFEVMHQDGGSKIYQGEEYKRSLINVEKYGGEKPMKFEEWVKAHKEIFV